MDVAISALSLAYGETYAVTDLDLEISDGESLALIGASGCGKTSTMRCIAGLEVPTGGRIAIDGAPVFDAAHGINVAPNKRNVGMVFQSYAIWPHRTVIENVLFPLKMKKFGKQQARKTAMGTLELVGLEHLADRGASQLSGGQMQRVALARSLAMRPSVLLLDEPLSNLDARLRDTLRIELRRIQQELGLTCVYVTHDQGEALALADQIAVMQGGRIRQLGTPEQVYSTPNSASIAQFMGVTNVFPVQRPGRAAREVTLAGHDLVMRAERELGCEAEHAAACIRPEQVRLSTEPADGTGNCWPGTIEVISFQGWATRYRIDLDDGPALDVLASGGPVADVRSKVWASAAPSAVRLLPGELQ